jgi:hypothetical protein
MAPMITTGVGVGDDLAPYPAVRPLQGHIPLRFGDLHSKSQCHKKSSLRNQPCECRLTTRSGRRDCPISRKRIERKTAASSTQRVRTLQDAHGIRSPREGRLIMNSPHRNTIQGCASLRSAHPTSVSLRTFASDSKTVRGEPVEPRF